MKKKKTFWPIGLTIVIVGFMLVKIGLVIYTFGLNRDLVTPNYYEEELAYQQQINRINRVNSLSDKMQIEVQDTKQLFFEFPEDIKADAIAGTIWMFRPDDKRYDKRIPIQVDNERRQWINIAHYKKGNWRVKVLWNDGNVDYYNEYPVYVN